MANKVYSAVTGSKDAGYSWIVYTLPANHIGNDHSAGVIVAESNHSYDSAMSAQKVADAAQLQYAQRNLRQ